MIQYRDSNVTVFQSPLWRTNSTVLQTDDLVLVVDPTWLPGEVEEIQQYVQKIQKGRPLYLLFTHSDWDHILGYRAFPGAITIASYEFVNQPDANKRASVDKIILFDCRYYLKRNYPIEYPNIDYVVKSDGQTLTVGNTQLTFYQAPGHTSCGMFTVVEPYGLFLAGDYASDVEFPFIGHNGRKYEQTLSQMESIFGHHNVSILVPGHGQPTRNDLEMQQRVVDAKQYIAELRRLLHTNDQEEIDRMIDRYEFSLGMRAFHESNQQILRKELEESFEISAGRVEH